MGSIWYKRNTYLFHITGRRSGKPGTCQPLAHKVLLFPIEFVILALHSPLWEKLLVNCAPVEGEARKTLIKEGESGSGKRWKRLLSKMKESDILKIVGGKFLAACFMFLLNFDNSYVLWK